MSKDPFDYKHRLAKAMVVVSKFRYTLVAILIVSVFGLAVYRVSAYSSVQRDEQLYQSLLQEIKGVEFDQETLERIFELEDLDVDIKSIFPDNRVNPFN